MAKSLMVVDDSATMRKLILRAVQQAKLDLGQIEEAGSGSEALEKLSNNTVDVMLCDVNMEPMNGIELVKKIRENSLFSNIKIVMISTERSEDIVEDCKAGGAIGYIKKPFTPETIKTELSLLFN